MSIIPTTVATNAMIIKINGKRGLTLVLHESLFANASWTIPPTRIKMIKVKNAINIPTINPIKVLIMICHQLGLYGSISSVSSIKIRIREINGSYKP